MNRRLKGLRIVLSIIFLLATYSVGTCQSCNGYYRNSRCYVKEAKGFNDYGQSRSATVVVNKIYNFQVVLYGQKDYIFSLCSQTGIQHLYFTLTDHATKTVIYDNSQDNYNRSIGFSMDKTSTIDVKVEAIMETKDNQDPETMRVCVGVQIFWRKIPKLGFN